MPQVNGEEIEIGGRVIAPVRPSVPQFLEFSDFAEDPNTRPPIFAAH
jgi:hypothetical protein